MFGARRLITSHLRVPTRRIWIGVPCVLLLALVTAAPTAASAGTEPVPNGSGYGLALRGQGLASAAGCNVSFGNAIAEFPDEEGGVSVTVEFSGRVDCTSGNRFNGSTSLVDRTSGFDGVQLGPRGSTVDGSGSATSRGSTYISTTADGGEEAETVFALTLTNLDGVPWESCNDTADARIISCSGLGTTTLKMQAGSRKYKTKKSSVRCKLDNHIIQAASQPLGVRMARAESNIRWCWSSRNESVTSVKHNGPTLLFAELPWVTIEFKGGQDTEPFRQLIGDGTYVGRYVSTFVVKVKAKMQIGAYVYEQDTFCEMTINDTYNGPDVVQATTNPCAAWRGRGPFERRIGVNKSSYQIGEAPIYTVSGAPNEPILWTSTRNGSPTGETNAFYGQYTDNDGNWTGSGAPWTSGQDGAWTKTITVWDQSASVNFTVAPPAVPVTMSVNRSTYQVGDNITYHVTGPPNTPIYWSSTLNGASTGENHSFYGHYTDATGNFVTTVGPWTNAHIGQWTKTVFIGSGSATAHFSVVAAGSLATPLSGGRPLLI